MIKKLMDDLINMFSSASMAVGLAFVVLGNFFEDTGLEIGGWLLIATWLFGYSIAKGFKDGE